MARYQVYVVGSDGDFVHCRVFACDTDEHAVEWAKQLLDWRAVELRSGARVVKRLSPPLACRGSRRCGMSIKLPKGVE